VRRTVRYLNQFEQKTVWIGVSTVLSFEAFLWVILGSGLERGLLAEVL